MNSQSKAIDPQIANQAQLIVMIGLWQAAQIADQHGRPGELKIIASTPSRKTLQWNPWLLDNVELLFDARDSLDATKLFWSRELIHEWIKEISGLLHNHGPAIANRLLRSPTLGLKILRAAGPLHLKFGRSSEVLPWHDPKPIAAGLRSSSLFDGDTDLNGLLADDSAPFIALGEGVEIK